MTVTIDIGESNDIHPANKQDVGKRLSLAALAKVYGREVVYSGPMYKSVVFTDGRAIVHFDHIGGGLTTPDKAPLQGFAIAGEDKKFVWTDAKIEGNTVVVSSPSVAKPAAVRYAWSSFPECNLFNKANLPASPFRTDDWPGVTVDNQ
jgi:sialate O-acetylesterase